MISQSNILSQNPSFLHLSSRSPPSLFNGTTIHFPSNPSLSNLTFRPLLHRQISPIMNSNSDLSLQISPVDSEFDRFLEVGNELADAAGEVIRKYFRKRVDIMDKEDSSPVTIADQAAEESMISLIQQHFPSHAIYGEENGWRCKEKFAEYVWVLDPIDGTKSFITGKPLFGTLIALLHKGKPIMGIIDQPILKERWIGMKGRKTILNGEEISTRTCSKLSQAYLYTTSPHLFSGEAVVAFERVRNKVKVPLYGCDCYAYALLASGFVDLVIESGLKPYDFLALIPVIEGAGGIISDWSGKELHWEPSSESQPKSFNIIASGDKNLHKLAQEELEWQ
ncbi:bifunctional phosphatase IMPL2, chloroplastic [Impatiens glandulifera]|uniref:bifunctional phosphatase IMPL2, chloroplastic n=1 Tax=Impatiens glandulifera TaxID=253017 RepID=UPI001FB172BF|nr:bifunctional phosphatase IMPL2, chloroplastic [Impatiens glandulifera]